MRILLINPSQSNVYGVAMPQVYPPLGLMYIAAVLEKDRHDIRLADIDAEGISNEVLVGILKEFRPELVGFSCTTSTFDNALENTRIVKKEKNVPVVFGGIHPTICPKGVIKHAEIDFIVKGEGEQTVLEFLRELENDKKFEKVNGLWFKREGKIVQNPDRELIEDLDTLPFPARHLLRNPERYVPADALDKPITSILSTRGCFGQCTYCCTKQIFGMKFRKRSIENILREIEYCIKNLGIKEFHIADDNFTADKKRTLEFCKAIKNKNYKVRFVFFNGLRADCVDRERLEALKSIGVISLGFGVESGNQTILNNIKKNITKEKVREAYKLAKEIGFETWGFFMMGLPGETEETINDTINFAKELDPDFAKFLILKPYPGSEVFRELDSKGLIFDKNYKNYGVYTGPVHNLESLSAADILYWQRKAYSSFYLRPSKIIKHILRIRSWTQLKFNLHSTKYIVTKFLT